MTTTLDDLPLPVPTHFRNGALYAFSADQIRADREMVWELAMRKALEGREPVVLPDGFFDALSDLLGDSNMAERVHRLITSWCDTSPPPKSDEARDAWTPDQIADACVSAEISDSKFESLLLALAAQQKGGL